MKIEKVIIPCFSCDYCYTCKYYQNATWDMYLFNHPEDGCPAQKYPFESIFQELLRQKKLKEQRSEHKRGYFSIYGN